MVEITAFVLRGRFNETEFNDLATLFRQFDARQPGRTLELCAVDPSVSALEIADAILKAALPPEPGRVTTFAQWQRGGAF